jgi:hypothetical protein
VAGRGIPRRRETTFIGKVADIHGVVGGCMVSSVISTENTMAVEARPLPGHVAASRASLVLCMLAAIGGAAVGRRRVIGGRAADRS